MITHIFIILGLITATGAAVKATEILVTRSVRGFRGIHRFGEAVMTLYEVSQDFKNNGETLRETLDLMKIQVHNLTEQYEVISMGCPMLHNKHE